MPDIDIILKGTDNASGKIKDVNRELGYLDGHSKGLGGALGTLTSVIGTGLVVAATAALAAISALGVGLGKSIGAAANMEQDVANIQSVFGKAAPPVEELNKLIQDLGLDPKLKVSATEAAAAINMLVKNGITWDQIQGGMARSTILLANATNDDFALAADIATDAIVNFNGDAGDMEDVINGIIGATQTSKFDLNDYALAMGQASGVAGAYGVSLEDFNAVMGATSSSFFSGSDAGTSFKVFLQRLVPDTVPAKTAMRELGLLTDDGANAFFTATGEMKSMSEIAQLLQNATKDLSDQKKIDTMTTIFGTDAQRTANALAIAGAAEIDRLKAVIGDTSAEDAAATRMDTLTGSWEIFKGVVETLNIQLGTAFLPIMREVVAWLTKMALEHGPKVIEWATKFATAVSYLWERLGFLTRTFEDGTTVLGEFLKELGVSDSTANAIGTTFTTVAGAVVYLWERMGFLTTIFEDGKTVIGEFLNQLGVSETTADAVGIAFATVAGAAVSLWNALLVIITGDFRGGIFGMHEDDPFIRALLKIHETIVSVWNALLVVITGDFRGGIFGMHEDDPFIGTLLKIHETIVSLWNAALVIITGDFRGGIFGMHEDDPFIGALLKIHDGFVAIGEWISTNIAPFVSFNDVMLGLGITLGIIFGPAIIASIVGFIAAIAPIAALLIGAIAAVSLLRNAWVGDWGGIKTATLDALDSIKLRFTPLVEAIKTFGTDALTEIGLFVTGNETEFTALGKIWDATKTAFGGFFTDLGNTVSTAAAPVLEWFSTTFPGATAALKKAWEDVSKRFGEIWVEIQKLFTTGSGEVGKILDGMKKWWQEHGDEVMKIVDNFLTLVITVIGTQLTVIANTIKMALQLLNGDWKGAWETLKDTVKVVLAALNVIHELFMGNLKEAWKLGLGDLLENAKTKWEEIKTNISTRIDAIRDNIKTKWEEIKQAIIDKVDSILISIKSKWEEIKKAVVDKASEILTSVTAKWEEIKTAVANKITDIVTNITTKWESIKTTIATKIGEILSNVNDKWESIKKAIVDKTTEIVTNVTTKWNEIKTAIVTKITEIVTNVTTKWEEIKTTITTKTTEIVTNITTKWNEIKTTIVTKITEIATSLTTKWEEIKTTIANKITEIVTNLTTKWAEIKTIITNKIEEIKATVTTKWEEIKAAITTKITEILTAVTTKWEEIKTAITTKITEIVTAVTTKWEEIKTAATTKWDEVKTSISTKMAEIVTTVTTKAAEIATGFITGIGDFVTKVTEKFTEVKTAVTGAFLDAGTWLTTAGGNVVQGFIDGIGGKIVEAQTKVAELATLAASAATAALGIESPSKVFVKIGQNAGQGFIDGMDSKLQLARKKAVELAEMASQAASQMVTHPLVTPTSPGVKQQVMLTPPGGGQMQWTDTGGLWSGDFFKPNRLLGAEWVTKILEDGSKVLEHISTKARLAAKDYIFRAYEDGTKVFDRIGAVFGQTLHEAGPALLQPWTAAQKAAQTVVVQSAQNSASLITDVTAGVARVLQHYQKFGEVMGAEQLNIASSIRSAVDAQVKLSLSMSTNTSGMITNVAQGVDRVFQHYRQFGEVMGAEEFKIDASIRAAVDAQVQQTLSMSKSTGGLITNVAQGVARVQAHYQLFGEVMGAEEFNIDRSIRSAVDSAVQQTILMSNSASTVVTNVSQGVSRVMQQFQQFSNAVGAAEANIAANTVKAQQAASASAPFYPMGQPAAESARIAAEIAARNAAAPLITTVAAGVAKVMDHLKKAGEVLSASSKSFNILDSIEAAVDAAVRAQRAATTTATQVLSNVRDFTNNPAYTTGNTSPGDLKFPTQFSTLMDNIQYMVATGDFPGKSANLPYYEDSRLMDLVLDFSQAVRQFGNSTSAASQGLTDIITGKLPIGSWDTWFKAMKLQLGDAGAQVGLQLGKNIFDYAKSTLGIHSSSASAFVAPNTPVSQGQSKQTALIDSLSKYILAVRDDGDWRNDWLTHLPTALADTFKKYFAAVQDDGDWANDWLTHLPAQIRNIVRETGIEFARENLRTDASGNTTKSPANFNVYVSSTASAVQDIRNAVELYALTFGAT